MLSRETAVKLKEAGFPETTGVNSGWYYRKPTEEDTRPFCDISHSPYNDEWLKNQENFTFIPTLSLLIEACNPTKADDFGLKVHINGWQAYYWYVGYFEHNKKFQLGDGMFEIRQELDGITPEEAVASLWLALNKKD